MSILGASGPFSQTEWPNPLTPVYPVNLRTHTQSLNTTTLARPFRPSDTTASAIAIRPIIAPFQNFTAIIPASTANPFKPQDLFARINAASAAPWQPLNLLISTLAALPAPFIPRDTVARSTAIKPIETPNINLFTTTLKALVVAAPFTPSDTTARASTVRCVDTPFQNFTALIPASAANPFKSSDTIARTTAIKPVDAPFQNVTSFILASTANPFKPASTQAQINPSNRIETPSLNLLQTTLQVVQTAPFLPQQWLASQKPVSLVIDQQVINNLVLNTTAPLPFKPTNTVAIVSAIYPIAAQQQVGNLLAGPLNPSGLPFAFNAWRIQHRPAPFRMGQTGGFALPLYVAPIVPTIVPGGGGGPKLNTILTERKRRRLSAEAKAAQADQARKDQLAEIMARYAHDDFLPFPLHDVIAQQQAEDDDMIMALLLST